MTGARDIDEWEAGVQALAAAAGLRRAGAVRVVNALAKEGWLLIPVEHWRELEEAAELAAPVAGAGEGTDHA